MKRREISRLWGEILFNNLLTLVITMAALGFLSIHVLSGRAWAGILGIAVIGIFLMAITKEVIWGVSATTAYLKSAPLAVQVRFRTGWDLPPGFKGAPEGPTPCYAYASESGPEQKLQIHPLIFKTDILKQHDGTAVVYQLKDHRPYAIETRAGVAWVQNWFS